MAKPEALTALDQFRIQEAAINADALESEKHYARVIKEQTKIQDQAAAARAKAQAILAGMVSDFERISDELEAEETKRLDLAGVTRQALTDGRITADAFFRTGLTDAEAAAKAQAAATEKLSALRDVARAQGVKVLELEAAELDAAYNVAFAQAAPAAAFRERLAALLKALDTSLASPLGIGGDPGVKTMRDAKLTQLQNAQGKRLTGDGWKDYDLAALKRLRLDPTFPESELGRLEEIIVEARTTGRRVRLMLDPRRKPHVSTIWEE